MSFITNQSVAFIIPIQTEHRAEPYNFSRHFLRISESPLCPIDGPLAGYYTIPQVGCTFPHLSLDNGCHLSFVVKRLNVTPELISITVWQMLLFRDRVPLPEITLESITGILVSNGWNCLEYATE